MDSNYREVEVLGLIPMNEFVINQDLQISVLVC